MLYKRVEQTDLLIDELNKTKPATISAKREWDAAQKLRGCHRLPSIWPKILRVAGNGGR